LHGAIPSTLWARTVYAPHVSLRGDSWLCVAGREQVIQILPERVIIRTFAARTVTNVPPTSTSCK